MQNMTIARTENIREQQPGRPMSGHASLSRPVTSFLSCLVVGLALLPLLASAEVRMPAILSDHLVLKRGAETSVWGKAAPDEAVVVTLGEATARTVTGADGRWRVTLDLTRSPAGPLVLTVEGKNRIVINDVLIGEVWLASGQSNMAFRLSAAVDAEGEIAGSANSQLRQFQVARTEAADPAEDCKGAWVVAAPETSGDFSAVAYFFGKRLQNELKVPVGIINSSVGGTPCEAWTSPQAISTDPHLQAARERALAALPQDEKYGETKRRKTPRRPQTEPSCLFNGMISPLLPCALSGVIWYQGEANARRAWQYRSAFPLMIRDWRNQWKRPDLPFYFCLLANYRPKQAEPADSQWAELREAQMLALMLPHTGQANLIDLGEAGDIHPRNKRDVGHRLAAVALANHYGRRVPFSGPIYRSMKIEGEKIRLAFTHADGGLVAQPLSAVYQVKTKTGVTEPLVRNSPGSELEGFAICGADHKWMWAEAKTDGESVLVWSDKIPDPVAVRYAWADNPTCNLSNKAGLPAAPFRTDDEPAITRDALY